MKEVGDGMATTMVGEDPSAALELELALGEVGRLRTCVSIRCGSRLDGAGLCQLLAVSGDFCRVGWTGLINERRGRAA